MPVGTLVWKLGPDEAREMVADIVDQEPVVMARGGSGGAGNSRFATSVNQEPVLAEKGGEGEEAILLMELKLLADVGLIGQPNAGKSSLLTYCSAAKPKIAPYPFTTTDPVLGVVATRDNSFVLVEVPGLIEGAHTGIGLGHEFLRHAERTRLLLHIVDGTTEDPAGDVARVNFELDSFDASLGQKPQFIVVNKLDIPEVRARREEIQAELSPMDLPVFFVSAATGEGVDMLMPKALEALTKLPGEVRAKERAVPVQSRPRERQERGFRVVGGNGVYRVHVPRVERMVPLANFKDWRTSLQIWAELKKLGVVQALEEMGVQPGDTVRLGGVELEWY